MYKVTRYPQSTFSWADNSSADPEAAKAFYVDLFGWSVNEIPIGENMTYTVFQLDGIDCAALSGMAPDQLEKGILSHWNNYVTVDDIDALVDVVNKNGGGLLFGPEDVFDSGRMMGIQDPGGAALNLWQPCNSIGAGIVNIPGAMVWNELQTWDAGESKAFYAALFGWEYFEPDSGYIFIMNRGRRNGGFLTLDESFGDMPTHWRTYFHIADIDRGLALVQSRGGEIHIPKLAIPDEDSYFAYVSDPAGAQFYLIQKAELDPWVE